MEEKFGSKWIEHLVLPIIVAVIAGIILLPITDVYKRIFGPSSDPEQSSPNGGFEDNVSVYSNGKIKYSSPEYGIDLVLPDGYMCNKYLQGSQNSQEEIELQYDSDLRIDIVIGEMPYEGFDSLEEYSDYYKEIYNQSPHFYKSFNFEKSIPYCVFSFNTDNGRGIYYELIYNSNGIYCATKFNYPTSKRDVCNEIVTDYCSYVKALG